jgi:pimeloyl-ACP methyl ester carboxylesterase
MTGGEDRVADVLQGFPTRYLELGDPRAETVVLIHDGAFGTDASLCWSPILELLAVRYRVVAPDLLGYGGTAKVTDFTVSPYEARIDHIARFCEAVGVTDAHFVGSSFGGSILLTAAVAKAWPMASGVSIGGSAGPFRIQENFEDLQRFQSTMEDARRLTAYLVEDVATFEDHIQARYENMLLPGHWEALESARVRNPSLPSPPRPDDYPENLGTCDIPLLIVEGQADRLMEDGWAERLAAYAKDGRAVTLIGAHSPHLEHPDLVVQTLVGFFSEVR